MNAMVLMGKPRLGGVRPIALIPMIHRLRTKLRKSEVDRWESTHREIQDVAIKDSSALRAAILSMFDDRLASLSEEGVAAILWDMEKFSDNIDVIICIRYSSAHGTQNVKSPRPAHHV